MEKRELFTGLIVILIGYFYVASIRFGERPVVKTENGFVRGIVSETLENGGQYRAFYNIPYAKPPIGKLRFEPPESAENWEEVRDAGKYGNQCAQYELLFTGWQYGSEDCLNLNVFVPMPETKPIKPFAVLIFIHGGYWHVGSAMDHGEKRFMSENIILVTFNYRLGALGFLSTGDHVTPGNMGLKDQHMVLKWVKNNIAKFGGDPNRVTIMGESVGAASVYFHILSPRSKGLFHRAIAQSGTPLNFFALNNRVKDQAKDFAHKFNCPTENSSALVQCLKGVEVKEILRAHSPNLDMFARTRLSMFAPTIEVIKNEKAFLTEDPLTVMERGDFPKIPMINGVNSDEGISGASVIMINATKQSLLTTDWKRGLPTYLWYPRNDATSQKVRDYYFRQPLSSEQLEANVTSSLSDRAFYHPFIKTMKLYTPQAETYLYYFKYSSFHSLRYFFIESESFCPELTMGLRALWRTFKEFVLRSPVIPEGSCHGDELPLQFTLPWTPYFLHMIPERDTKVSKEMVRTWAAFVKSWEPLIYDRVEWKPQNSSKGPLKYLEISTEPKMISEPFSSGVKFWESIEKDL